MSPKDKAALIVMALAVSVLVSFLVAASTQVPQHPRDVSPPTRPTTTTTEPGVECFDLTGHPYRAAECR